MPSPAWSPAALSALKRLHAVDHVVYVEGKTDIPFWRAVFARLGIDSFHIKTAGDCHQLARVARAAAEEGAVVIVAADRDYRPWVDVLYDHPRVIYTYGYSIENFLYCPEFLSALVRDFAAIQSDQRAAVEKTIRLIAEAVIDLVVLDLADRLSDTGVGPLGDSCARFITAEVEPRHNQIEEAAAVAGSKIAAGAIEKARKLLNQDPRPWSLVVRGHFLSHAVLRMVECIIRRETGDRLRISHDVLRGTLVGRLAGAWPNRPEFSDLKRRVAAATAP